MELESEAESTSDYTVLRKCAAGCILRVQVRALKKKIAFFCRVGAPSSLPFLTSFLLVYNMGTAASGLMVT